MHAHNQYLFIIMQVAVIWSIIAALTGVSPASDSMPEALRYLGRPAADEVQIDLRLTTLEKGGKRSVSSMSIDYACNDQIARLIISPIEKDKGMSTYCLACKTNGTPQPCRDESGVFPDSPESRIADTLLPWHAVTDWLCPSFKKIKRREDPEGLFEIYEILAEEQSVWSGSGKRVVYISRKTGEPERIERFNRRNSLTASISILEVRKTMWGKVVTRSVYSDAETLSRVLIEVVSGAASMPREERKK